MVLNALNARVGMDGKQNVGFGIASNVLEVGDVGAQSSEKGLGYG
jgi:hypothetical protein